MKRLFSAIGPAIIVAAVVLGPGSILTSSKVGAQQGLIGIPIIFAATTLMLAMVILSARLGAVCQHSLCTELAQRLGRWASTAIGLILFLLVAIFQSSNNAAVIGGIEPLFGDGKLSIGNRIAVLATVNVLIICCLYLLPHLYKSVERLMKIMIAIMVLAFVTNLAVVFSHERGFVPVAASTPTDWLPILGLIGTTFSVGGAFYQAYLVKEKGWGINDVKAGTVDSILSISVLGLITCVVLLTAWRVFHGSPDQTELSSIGQIALVLEPSFGPKARIIFACGILAGAFSSFLGNALIGGTVLSDSLGKGARLQDRWPLHFTAAALLVGFAAAAAALTREGSTVHLITFAQALTVLGLPAIAASLVYLGSRADIQRSGQIPGLLMVVAVIGLCVSCVMAAITVNKVWAKLAPRKEIAVQQSMWDSSAEDRWLQCRITRRNTTAAATPMIALGTHIDHQAAKVPVLARLAIRKVTG
jgi:Mn2+/Fe2+ NRAMP family transporter